MHDPIALVWLDAGKTRILDEVMCAEPDALIAALPGVEVVEDPVPCDDDCAQCRAEAREARYG